MTDVAKPEHRRLEILSVVLLAMAALSTAWASYQSARWHGEQAQAQTRATSSRLESTRASDVANREGQIDVAIFIQWVDARARGETDLEAFYEARFREEFVPAFEAWIAAEPFTNPDAPLSPFAVPEYDLDATRQAARLEAQAAAASDEAREDIQRADNYVLAVVLFASALFFAGISTKLGTLPARASILALGYLVFVTTVVWIATFPVSVAV